MDLSVAVVKVVAVVVVVESSGRFSAIVVVSLLASSSLENLNIGAKVEDTTSAMLFKVLEMEKASDTVLLTDTSVSHSL